MSAAGETERLLVAEIGVILGLPPAGVKPDVPLHTLGMDSMSFVELLVFIEKKFKLNLMATGLNKEDFQSVRALARRIQQETAG